MIELKNIQKIFYKNSNEIQALKNINLKINEGDIFGVIGFSGAGKSTLIRMVNYLEQPTFGEVIVNDQNLANLSPQKLRLLRKQIGMIFQHFNLLESKTVFENVSIPLLLEGTDKNTIYTRVTELLDFVGLASKADAYPDELSGGQKQRVGIARALATNPFILLCDEATSALDPQTTGSILQLLKEINKKYKITILIITHEMNVIREICNRVAVMEKGEIIEEGSLLDIFENPQQQTTKNFIRTIVHDEIPQVILNTLDFSNKNKLVLKLKFIGENSQQALLSEACYQYNVQPNILFANVTELQGDILGHLTVELNGTPENIEKTHQYLLQKNVGIEVVENGNHNNCTNNQSDS